MMFRFGRRARAAAKPVAPGWVDMAEPDLLIRFREAVGCWAMDLTSSEQTVMLACELLVEGFDGGSLRDLAGRGLRDGWADSRDVLAAACAELDVEFTDRGSEGATRLAMRHLCRELLSGALSERMFVEQALGTLDYGPSPISDQLAELDYLYNLAAEGYGRPVSVELAATCARTYLAATA